MRAGSSSVDRVIALGPYIMGSWDHGIMGSNHHQFTGSISWIHFHIICNKLCYSQRALNPQTDKVMQVILTVLWIGYMHFI